jgi:hypothetical protein
MSTITTQSKGFKLWIGTLTEVKGISGYLYYCRAIVGLDPIASVD